MRIKNIYWEFIKKTHLLTASIKLKLGLKTTWGKGLIQSGAIINGPLYLLVLDENAIIHSGAVISTEFGGKVKIGRNTSILYGAMLLTYSGNITIGDDCSVNPYAVLYGHGNLTIGNGVRIATHSVIIPSNHTFDDINTPIFKQPNISKGINILDDVWVGCDVKILDGVTIGNGSVIAAGAVVNTNIDAFTVNAGIPSKVIKNRIH